MKRRKLVCLVVLTLSLAIAAAFMWWLGENQRPAVYLVDIQERQDGLRQVSFVLENNSRAVFTPNGSTRFLGMIYRFPSLPGAKVHETYGLSTGDTYCLGDGRLQPGEKLGLRMYVPTSENGAPRVAFQFGIRVQRDPSELHRKITAILSRWLPIPVAKGELIDDWSETVTP